MIEMGEAEYMIRAGGYIEGIEDLREVPVGLNPRGTPILLSDIAENSRRSSDATWNRRTRRRRRSGWRNRRDAVW